MPPPAAPMAVPKGESPLRDGFRERAFGAIAQLGERYNGIVEVAGSIPAGSTISFKGLVKYD